LNNKASDRTWCAAHGQSLWAITVGFCWRLGVRLPTSEWLFWSSRCVLFLFAGCYDAPLGFLAFYIGL
jgi:hypothetical protein